MARKLREWLLAIVITLVSVELALIAAAWSGIVDLPLPSYSASGRDPFWEMTSPDFGVWHRPNASFRHQRACFDVVYTSNAYGMRDHAVEMKSSAPRVVVLGDSFVEGWGVAYGNRFVDRLENLTGLEHLAFGTSGAFGPTSEWQLYKALGSKFDHDAVILEILPDNDFADDMPLRYKSRASLVGSYPDYQLHRPDMSHRGEGVSVDDWTVVHNFWLTSTAIEAIVAYGPQRLTHLLSDMTGVAPKSHYYEYTPAQFDRMRYAIEQIKSIAGDRPMLVFSIPRPEAGQRQSR